MGELIWTGSDAIEVSEDGRWLYYVTYTYHDGGPAAGAMTVAASLPITSDAAVYGMTEEICRHNRLAHAVVTNWKLLQAPASAVGEEA